MDSMKLGIMSAMPEEIQRLIVEMGSEAIETHGMREYHSGKLWGIDAILVFSRWGKVAAASTATTLISHYGVNRILFTGVAGAADPTLHLGDVVVGTGLIQHDMDARPLFPLHEIPLIGQSCFATHPEMTESLFQAAEKFIKNDFSRAISQELRREFHLSEYPSVQRGTIASGDKFFASQTELTGLKKAIPDALCVEMEGAAVAQICHEYQIPLAVMRTISDSADAHAPAHFPKFIRSIASEYSFGILKELLAVQ